MMMWYGNNMSGWGYAGMGIGMVLFWALIIVGIVALVRSSSGKQQGGRAQTDFGPTPEALLAARFARGEISDAQYRDNLGVLREHTRQ
jgi:putative membrane protein